MEEKLRTFTQKLLEWNKIHNLTGAKSEQEIQKNIEDSVAILPHIPQNVEKALDIGTGAGFPGLILAIAMPQTHWTLAEPRKKRASFLHYIKTLLDLENVTVADKRVEKIEPFKADLITSRAVTKTKDLLALAHPFIKDDTIIVFYKGQEAPNELEGIENFKMIQHGKRNYVFIKGKDAF
ncbi:16S rRNA (guanine(527)-N(7))-methyltransferase RsmG [Nitratiruptor sp. YY09-18]|uniref:16S rRNA (guanine(527)-N(7))-methyltransferase RsmG n=1 Tax=Nitratiruptor sp. YY09-18 TaxID=2724901 RepID=UPI0019156975|nr:16S rRNA (guanine(527)-N(7))-methyltransferase RsmG [Nitratiruptor sp. YY09-18]BCD67504.1 16S rRNA (guanine527-N7)-methyltransferase [Nitratiruptor sp. YY09-18]